jgi:polysaccharide biosynthesis protein PslH
VRTKDLARAGPVEVIKAQRAGETRATLRALFLTCHLPYPPVSGGRLREFELLRRLACEVELHLCAVSKTFQEDLAAAARLKGLCASVAVFPAMPSGEDGVPSQVRRHRSPDASEYVRSLLGDRLVDLVHVEGFYLLDHVPEPSPIPVLLVEQNIEYTLWEQRVALAPHAAAQRRAFLDFRETRAYELDAWQRATLCASVTDEDRRAMLQVAPQLTVRVVPDGVDHLGSSPLTSVPSQPELVFVANFAYQPNVDAAFWFCREIFPRVREQVPQVRALLVGNGPPTEVQALACDHICVTGRVPSVAPYLDRAAVVVSPLRVGGGIKVKMLEALSRCKAIVSTSVGVQGLGKGIRDCVAVADDATAFSTACASLIRQPRARRRLEQRARMFVATLPTWDEAAESLLSCYRELLETRKSLPSVG